MLSSDGGTKAPRARPGPPGGLRDANRRARIAELLRAAGECFLAQGVEAVSVDEIAGRAGVAKGSFYTYFHDKTDLVSALLAPVRAGIGEAFDRCEADIPQCRDGEALRAVYLVLANDLAAVVFAHPAVGRLYLQECRSPAVGARAPVAALAAEIRARALGLTEAARKGGLVRSLDARVTAAAVVGAAEHLVFRALSGDDFGDAGEALGALVAMVVEGIAARGEGPRSLR